MRFKSGALIVLLLWLAMPAVAHAEDGDDPDVYKWRMTGSGSSPAQPAHPVSPERREPLRFERVSCF
jgi:hypothetical protein